MSEVTTHYELLGVPEDASDHDIKAAYRRLARRMHPDANPDDHAAAERFKETAVAYRVLADPRQRAAYDHELHTRAHLEPEVTDDGDGGRDGDARPPGVRAPLVDAFDGDAGWGTAVTPDTEQDEVAESLSGDDPAGDDHSRSRQETVLAETYHYGTELRLVDYATCLVVAMVAMWGASAGLGASLGGISSDFQALGDAFDTTSAIGDPHRDAVGDLGTSIVRVAAVPVVGAAAWILVGAAMRWQSTLAPRPPAWWRSPGWDGAARLVRVVVFLPLAALAMATLLAPWADSHFAERGAGNAWRWSAWLLLTAVSWLASGKVPEHLGFSSRYQRALAEQDRPT